MNTKMEWYETITDGQSVNAVALKAGLPQTSLNRRVRLGKIEAGDVIAIGRAYGVGGAKALLDAGFLNEADVAIWLGRVALDRATDREVADEVWRRMSDGRLDEDGEPAVPEGPRSPRSGSHLSVVSAPDDVMAASDPDENAPHPDEEAEAHEEHP